MHVSCIESDVACDLTVSLSISCMCVLLISTLHIIQENRRAFVASTAESIYATLSEVRY